MIKGSKVIKNNVWSSTQQCHVTWCWPDLNQGFRTDKPRVTVIVSPGCWGRTRPVWHLAETSGKCEPGPEPLSCSPTSPAACSSRRQASGATVAGQPEGEEPPQTPAARSWPGGAHSPLHTCMENNSNLFNILWIPDVSFKIFWEDFLKIRSWCINKRSLFLAIGNPPSDLLL